MSDKPISPLRRRMIEDMTVRNFVEKTRNDYIRHVRTFTTFLGRAPDTAAPEDLRLFQLHQTQAKLPAASRGMLSAKQEPVCSFNPHSLAPNAAIRLSRRCRPMPASSSMTARAVANGSSLSRAIAACFALTARCRARRYRATCAACLRFIKCPEALKARSRRRRRCGNEVRPAPRKPTMDARG
jgi:Phage integrase, N-terminal SAM-like domain